MVGIGMITFERIEQLQKHGRSVQKDVECNARCELAEAARILSQLHLDPKTEPPKGWATAGGVGAVWKNIASKPYLDRLVIAGALIAAEVDRVLWLDAMGNDNYNIDEIPEVPMDGYQAKEYNPDEDETRPETA